MLRGKATWNEKYGPDDAPHASYPRQVVCLRDILLKSLL